VQGEVAVVGQEEQAAGVSVEAADGIGMHAAQVSGKQVKDGGASLGVADGAEVVYGFMQEYVDFLDGWDDGFAVDTDVVMSGVDAGTLRGDGYAVDLDTTGGDEFFGVTARSYAGVG
jgi:hypothetical protein